MCFPVERQDSGSKLPHSKTRLSFRKPPYFFHRENSRGAGASK